MLFLDYFLFFIFILNTKTYTTVAVAYAKHSIFQIKGTL